MIVADLSAGLVAERDNKPLTYLTTQSDRAIVLNTICSLLNTVCLQVVLNWSQDSERVYPLHFESDADSYTSNL